MNHIFRTSNSETAKYSARELAKYLTAITGSNTFAIECVTQLPKRDAGITLCLMQDAGIPTDVENTELDDAIFVDIKAGCGIIAGSNERAVLIGVYQFLTALGCRFLRPGDDGEILVRMPINEMNVHLEHTASYRHRGVCIEGADSYENVVDMLHWLPKVGGNSYFAQFPTSYTFFNQWYSHKKNAFKQPEYFDREIGAEMTQNAAQEAKRAGLLYHAVGHGWTCGCLGIEGLNWEPQKIELNEDQKECVALVNGQRVLFGDIAVDTNLCYSSEKVRQRLTDFVVEYAKEHPEADYIHLWIADNFNNHCECERCQTMTPTDWYVSLIQLLDEKLTANKLPTRIVFLLYFELLWPPTSPVKLNTDRFTLMFAPFTRTFGQSYAECTQIPQTLPEFHRNQVKLPEKVDDYIGHLHAWQAVFDGDSFDYDYYLGCAHFGDPSYYKISQLISRDVKYLKEMGINGIISCQVMRAFFPNGLPNYTMMQTLWDDSIEFNALSDDYYSHLYGEDWKACKTYFKSLADCVDVAFWQVPPKGFRSEDVAVKALGMLDAADAFEPVVMENLGKYDNPTLNLSWDYLSYHLTYCRLYGRFVSAKASGDEMTANLYWSQFKDFVCENEDALQRVLDVYYLTHNAEYAKKYRKI